MKPNIKQLVLIAAVAAGLIFAYNKVPAIKRALGGDQAA